ncbi:MAG: hypothetical protein JJO71_10260 [Escherichia coli]|nr:hypothetical protein [Escherichia coli]MBL0989742.1 hypothetical protein [Escherichia coli]MBL0999229.1 hypothetical protein [Escherichia coli]MBL1004037.1 hypothetical protein [Escherichia coli]
METRKNYAFVLCVGGEIKQLITILWCEEADVVKFMKGMRKAAGLFKKTAAILAYTYKAGKRWTFADACDCRGNVYIPEEITIDSDCVILYD